jgi:maleylacetoacetate isomerase
LTQSLAIIEYLDGTRNLGLLKNIPAERAKWQALAQSTAINLDPICNLQVSNYAIELTSKESTRNLWMKRFITPSLEAFEHSRSEKAQTRFSTDNYISIAKLYLTPQIYNIQHWQVGISQCKRIKCVVNACSNLQEFAIVHPDSVTQN